MTSVHFLAPGDINRETGGYRYDREVIAGLRRLGYRVAWHALADSFPRPDPVALEQAAAVLARLPAGAAVVIDGLALAPLADLLPAHPHRLRLIALIHHPLADETGLSADQQRRFFELEQRALVLADKVIVTSPFTARELERYGVAAENIAVVLPGTEPVADHQVFRTASSIPLLLCVATLIPRKGHRFLIEALGQLRELPWRLVCIGSLTTAPPTVAEIRELIAEHGLGERVELMGELTHDMLAAWYRQADLFVLPSQHEGYGMALGEALAYGLPIVSTKAGAIPDTVPPGAGLLTPPGDTQALAAALRLLLTDSWRRQQLAAAARQAGRQLPAWPETAARFAAALAIP